GRAGLGGADVADEGALDRGHLALAATGLAGLRLGLALPTLTVAAGTQHRGVDLDRLGGAEGGIDQVELDPDQGILAATHPRSRTPAVGAVLAEHGAHQVGEVEALGA